MGGKLYSDENQAAVGLLLAQPDRCDLGSAVEAEAFRSFLARNSGQSPT